MANIPRVQRSPVPVNYRLYYHPRFDLSWLRTTPLETFHETPDRLRLAASIAERGLLQPLIVWNHTSTSRRPGPRPWYLKIGYNKLWAVRHLGWSHAPVLYSLDATDSPLAGSLLVEQPRDLEPYWLDGTFLWSATGPSSKPTARLEYYFNGEPPELRKKFVDDLPSVIWQRDPPYSVWYVEKFPLERLRYRDLYKMDPGGRNWRQSLLEDIKERGIRGGPLLVYNHQHNDPELRMVINKPFYLRVGRNRRWALRELGYTHAPCIVTGDLEEGMDGIKLTKESMPLYLTDGEWEVTKGGIYVRGKADASQYEYPR